MKTFVFVVSMVIGGELDEFARGPFDTENRCWEVLRSITRADMERDMYIGRCMPLDEYRRDHSRIPLQRGEP